MKLFAFVLMMAFSAGGQQFMTCGTSSDGHCVPVQIPIGAQPAPAPLKCGKWEDEVGPRGLVNCRPVKGSDSLMQCDDAPPVCTPKLHTVTEKEWVELMERLKKLEAK